MESNYGLGRIIYFTWFLMSWAFVGYANACSDVSADGCPTVLEIDDNAAAFTGTWKKSNAILLWYGDDYEVVQGTGGAASATAAFSTGNVDLEVNGDYSVYARWTAHPNRCTSATYKIYNGPVSPASLIATVTANQTVNGGAWQRLGTYQFTRNRIPRVVVDNSGCVGKYVVADGIRFIKEDNDHNSIVDEAGIEYAEGIQSIPLDSTIASIREITVTPPADGMVVVNFSGFWGASEGGGSGRCSIVQPQQAEHDTVSVRIGTMGAGGAASFAGTRVFNVTKDVSVTYRLICDASSGFVTVNMTNVTAIFSTTRY